MITVVISILGTYSIPRMSEGFKSIVSIKSWAPDDQPRFKLRHKGASALSDSELLAILIGSGTAEISAVELCKRILQSVDHDLDRLARLDLAQLKEFRGIGEVKAITISAALELGRRRQFAGPIDKVPVTDSLSAFQMIAPILVDKNHEEFWILLLNRSNCLIERCRISQGGVAGTFVDPKIIFKKSLETLASGVILCHNHPSGKLRPSRADIQLTKKLQAAGSVLDVQILDHLIVGGRDYFSFADEGML